MSDLAITRGAESRLTQPALLAALLAVAAAGWLLLAGRVAGMDTGPGGDPGALGWFTVTWAVMTVAMMLPASGPVLARRARAWRGAEPLAGGLLVAGYASVWMLAGLIGYVAIEGFRDLHIHALAWGDAGRYVAGASVVAAGLFQFTGAKRRWLERCTAARLTLPGRSPASALLAGLRHGACCVACCWTLMAVLYALGMMSVTWMAVVAGLIAGERLLPRPALAVHGVAAVLIILGVAIALSPADVPALTIPSHHHAMAMTAMGMAR